MLDNNDVQLRLRQISSVGVTLSCSLSNMIGSLETIEKWVAKKRTSLVDETVGRGGSNFASFRHERKLSTFGPVKEL